MVFVTVNFPPSKPESAGAAQNTTWAPERLKRRFGEARFSLRTAAPFLPAARLAVLGFEAGDCSARSRRVQQVMHFRFT